MIMMITLHKFNQETQSGDKSTTKLDKNTKSKWTMEA